MRLMWMTLIVLVVGAARPQDAWAQAIPDAAQEPSATGHAAPAARPRDRSITVDLSAAPEPAGLYQLVPATAVGLDSNLSGSLVGGSDRKKICDAPCGLAVPPGLYEVGGPGLRSSPRFELTGDNPRVRVEAKTGTENALLGGAILAGAGAFSVLVGLPMIALGNLAASDPDFNGVKNGPALRNAGLVMTGGGIVAAVVGVAMVMGSSTTVDLHPTR